MTLWKDSAKSHERAEVRISGLQIAISGMTMG